MYFRKLILPIFISLFAPYAYCQSLTMGAEQWNLYKNQLDDKKIGLVINHTSLIQEQHLVDFLLEKEADIKYIFAPEHGFRGNAAPGEKVDDQKDPKTGLPVISLYGKNKKPDKEIMDNIDAIIFDIQDVGCRFYTYISTMYYVMGACAENNKKLIVLDRPNPNGDYVAGPVLKPEFKSFVGMLPIPVVHGLTVGELAKMINGEGWLADGQTCGLTVVPVKNYTHSMNYPLPVKPSPNLPNDLSIRLYPSLCFFEATNVSIGRGTEFPFQVIGHPKEKPGGFSFTPADIPGVANNPKQKGQVCYGIDFRKQKEIPNFTWKYFLEWYHKFDNEEEFISSERWLNLLAGTDEVIKMIRNNSSAKDIEDEFQEEINEYKEIRKKYLLYPDFE